MKNKFLPLYSLAFSIGLLFSASDSNAENIFTSSMSKAGSAVVSASKATGSAAVKTAKIITPDSFFIEGSKMDIEAGEQIYGIEDSNYRDESVNNNTDNAFRLGIAYDLEDDKELQISYFEYEDSNSDSTSMEGIATYSNPNGGATYGDSDYNSADARFKHKVNTLDISIAKSNLVSKNLNLQFSGGLKYANYERNVRATYYGGEFLKDGESIDTNTKFRGIGPKAGIEADYKIAGGFAFFGGADLSLILGDREVDRIDVDDNGNGAFSFKERVLMPIIAGDIGIKWSKQHTKDYNFEIKLGYHVESWESGVMDNGYSDDVTTTIDSREDDLILSGAYLRTTFSF